MEVALVGGRTREGRGGRARGPALCRVNVHAAGRLLERAGRSGQAARRGAGLVVVNDGDVRRRWLRPVQ